MAQPIAPETKPLPVWLMAGGSVVIVLHFVAILGLALSAPSGPWVSEQGPNMMPPPAFAQEINTVAFERYLRPLKFTHNYHFTSNRQVFPGIKIEVQLRDKEGREIETVKLPDAEDCFWTRHRHQLLARAITDDRFQPGPGPEVIAPAGEAPPEATYWALKHELPEAEQAKHTGSDDMFVLYTKPEHLLPRERPLMRPSDWSLVVVRSYVRYLCRKHGAASGELFRTIRPAEKEAPDAPWQDQIASYGVVESE